MKKAFSIFLGLLFLLFFACEPEPLVPVGPDDPTNDTTTVDTTTVIDTTIVIDTTTVIDTTIVEPVLTPHKWVLIVNEGGFTSGTSSLSFYDIEKDSVANYVFLNANGAPLGDVGESMTLLDDKLYIVVNNSKYIYKMDSETFVCDLEQPYQLTGFYSPRYMLPVASDKAYISDIVGTDLWIINPQDMTITGTIDMGKSTECMLLVDDELFVTNWSRYYVQGMENNTVQVVNTNNDTKIADITVGMEPNCMVKDKNGDLWVMCEGDVNDPTVPSTLWKIDPSTKNATLVKTFEKKALNLAIDPTGTYLYFVYGGDWTVGGDVRRISVDNPSEMDGFEISGANKMFYKIFVDPWDGDIYLTDAKNYTVEGTVYRYSSTGSLIKSFDAGICPGYMLFY